MYFISIVNYWSNSPFRPWIFQSYPAALKIYTSSLEIIKLWELIGARLYEEPRK